MQWQHLGYEHQTAAKRQQVIDNFKRIGKFEFPEVNPIIVSENTTHYRNKLEYTFSRKRWFTNTDLKNDPGPEERDNRALGFHIPGSADWAVCVV